mgnify:CR=1 FL=1
MRSVTNSGSKNLKYSLVGKFEDVIFSFATTEKIWNRLSILAKKCDDGYFLLIIE